MKKDNTSKIILGIDPGSSVMGYGIIKATGQELTLLSMGVIKLAQYGDHFQRLHKIYKRVGILIKQYDPEELAIEAPFYGKNVQSMLKLGRAQGMAIAAAIQYNLPVFEYAPRKIKQSITGNGNASKEQVAAMLCQLIKMELKPSYTDATDGLATALCHHLQAGNMGNTKRPSSSKYNSWKDFVKNNSQRLG